MPGPVLSSGDHCLQCTRHGGPLLQPFHQGSISGHSLKEANEDLCSRHEIGFWALLNVTLLPVALGQLCEQLSDKCRSVLQPHGAFPIIMLHVLCRR